MPSSDSARNAPASSKLRSLRAWLINGLAYLGSLILAALVIAPWLPVQDIPAAGEKIRYLSLHGNDYDTIFVGSSRVNFQVLPSIFDRATAESGRPTKSF